MQVPLVINMVALDHGQPRLFNLKEIIEAFVLHRREVVTRRSIFELRKARERTHILEGLAVARSNIDEMIAIIRNSKNREEAATAISSRSWTLHSDIINLLDVSARPDDLEENLGIQGEQYYLSPAQVNAILELRLHRLTGIAFEEVVKEYEELLVKIADLLHILSSAERLMEVIREELEEVKAQFGDDRLTEITAASGDIDLEDLIAQEDVVVTLSHEGYVKYQPLTDYEAQRRGGKGKSATKMKEEDFIEKLLVANTHDTILCFSSRGRLY